jgi:hypothetical protein
MLKNKNKFIVKLLFSQIFLYILCAINFGIVWKYMDMKGLFTDGKGYGFHAIVFAFIVLIPYFCCLTNNIVILMNKTGYIKVETSTLYSCGMFLLASFIANIIFLIENIYDISILNSYGIPMILSGCAFLAYIYLLIYSSFSFQIKQTKGIKLWFIRICASVFFILFLLLMTRVTLGFIIEILKRFV